MYVCVFQDMDKLPPLFEKTEFKHLVPNVSETEPNLNSSQRENDTGGGRSIFPFAFLTRCKLFQTRNCLDVVKACSMWTPSQLRRGRSSIPDHNVPCPFVREGGIQPTESCGSPAAFLTGQTCSSCC